jgi:mannose-1-phosphate guanylyltransferase
MKEKVSISLDRELVKKIDNIVNGFDVTSRSHAIEKIVGKYFEGRKVKKALILCGGEGTRLRPITYEIPKPMVPLKGKPILEHIIDHLKDSGIEEVILAVGYKHEQIISHFGNGKNFGLKINYVIEKEPLGTGGPLKLAKGMFDESFLILNGDVISKIDLVDMIRSHRKNNALVTIALTTVKEPEHYGVAMLKGEKIIGFLEKPKEAQSNLINAGVYIIEPGFLEELPKENVFMIENVFENVAKEGRLFGYVYDGKWYDLGTPERYEEAIKEWN